MGIDVEAFDAEFPGGNAFANQTTRNLVRLADVVNDALNVRFRIHDLHLAAAQALAVLEGAAEPLTPNEISAHLHLTSGTVTTLLDRLQERGLVVRHPHPVDRRKVLVEITDEGRALVDIFLPEAVAIQTALFSVLSDAQLMELGHLIELVLRATDEVDPHQVADAAPPRGPH